MGVPCDVPECVGETVEVVEVEDVGKLVPNWWLRLLQSSLLSTALPAPYCTQSWRGIGAHCADWLVTDI